MRKPSVLILVSGRGSNMVRLVEAAADYVVAGVGSDREDAPALGAARDLGVPVHVFPRGPGREGLAASKRAVEEHVLASAPDFVALAGFMQILLPGLVEKMRGRILNVHPSLLPDFPGLDTHRRAVLAGVRRHGCTVHFVDAGVDTGPVVAQAACACSPGDDPDELAARVLVLEHRLYPFVLNGAARGEVSLSDGRALLTPRFEENLRAAGFSPAQSPDSRSGPPVQSPDGNRSS